MRPMTGFNELRERARMTWIEQEHGWVAAPEEIVKALAKDGFEECKRETTTSRRDLRPAGGVWQGVNPRTGSVASAIWVTRPSWDQAIVFVSIDGESLKGGDHGTPAVEADPYKEEGEESRRSQFGPNV